MSVRLGVENGFLAVEPNLAKLNGLSDLSKLIALTYACERKKTKEMSARFFIFEIGRWVGQLCSLANDGFVSHDINATFQPDLIDSITNAMVKVLFNVLQLSKYMKFTLQVCVQQKIILNGRKYPVVASKVSLIFHCMRCHHACSKLILRL